MLFKLVPIVLFVTLLACVYIEFTPNKPSQTQLVLEGEHRLHKMPERTDGTSRTFEFFLFAGDFTQSTSTAVKFAWEMKDGSYAISSLPLEKIRIRFDEKATTPTIRFQWSTTAFTENMRDLQRMIDYNVHWAVITTRESDWPAKVDLPITAR